VTLALIPVWFIVCLGFLPLSGGSRLAVLALLTLGSILGPDAILNRRVAERQHEIQVRLPDVLDLLTISVEAGLGFEQALDRTVAAVPGPLSDEFARMLGEVRAGASRADAMRAMDERIDVPEVRSFVLAILQADTFGVSIGRVLRAQADEMRIKRRQLAQEQALKAPVKMLFPMVFCIFPALFVVVIGPAVINISKNFK
jgi:tight adherence protein C